MEMAISLVWRFSVLATVEFEVELAKPYFRSICNSALKKERAKSNYDINNCLHVSLPFLTDNEFSLILCHIIFYYATVSMHSIRRSLNTKNNRMTHATLRPSCLRGAERSKIPTLELQYFFSFLGAQTF